MQCVDDDTLMGVCEQVHQMILTPELSRFYSSFLLTPAHSEILTIPAVQWNTKIV